MKRTLIAAALVSTSFSATAAPQLKSVYSCYYNGSTEPASVRVYKPNSSNSFAGTFSDFRLHQIEKRNIMGAVVSDYTVQPNSISYKRTYSNKIENPYTWDEERSATESILFTSSGFKANEKLDCHEASAETIAKFEGLHSGTVELRDKIDKKNRDPELIAKFSNETLRLREQAVQIAEVCPNGNFQSRSNAEKVKQWITHGDMSIQNASRGQTNLSLQTWERLGSSYKFGIEVGKQCMLPRSNHRDDGLGFERYRRY